MAHHDLDDSVAMDRPGTHDAWRRFLVRRVWTATGGLAGLAVATALTAAAPDGETTGTAAVIAYVGFASGGLAFAMGGWGTVRAVRIRHMLRRRPWVRRRCRYRIEPRGANGQPALIVRPSKAEPEAVCSVSTTVFQYRQIPQGEEDLLVCGNPRRWAVIAPHDMRLLVVVKRPTIPGWSRVLRRYAEGS